MNVVVNGLMTNYEKFGNGKKTLLLLHGWGDNAKTFSKLVGELGDEYSILVLDLPGFGGTQAPEKAWDLTDYAAFVHDCLNKIDAPEPYGLIGHSFGGAVAVKALGARAIKADKLILISASGIRSDRSLKKKIMRGGAKVLKIPLYLLPTSKMDKVKTVLYHKAGSDIMLIPHMRQTFLKIIRDDVQQIAKSIKSPTLLIYGSRDKETPVAYGRLFMQAIHNSRLEVIEGGGHFVHQERAAEVAGLIANFLKAGNE